jgi:arabinoxylan arabinofuranohydrolase
VGGVGGAAGEGGGGASGDRDRSLGGAGGESSLGDMDPPVGDPPLGGTGGAMGELQDDVGSPDDGPDAGETPEPAPPNAAVPNPIVTHIFTADPSAYAFEGRIYVYASHDPDDQMGYDMVDYHVFSSSDLANWQDHGVVLDSAEISFASKLYAPDCAYDAELDKYFLYFPDAGSTIGVAVSDDPGGPFLNPTQLVTTQTPGVSDVDWLFDPTAFFDDDGQGYLYFGGGPEGTGDNARVIRLGSDRVSLMDSSATTIIVPNFFEASFMFKRQGTYYFSYSTNFANGAPTIDYMVSDDPMSGFEQVGTVIPSPAENNGDNNHHSMVEYEGQWYVFYHNRVQSNLEGYSNFQRSITLDKLSWEGDRMVQVSANRGEVQQLRSVNAFERIEAELIAGQSGIETDFAMDGGGRTGVALTDLQDGDWVAVSQVDFGQGATALLARVASAGGGTIEVLQGGCQGFRNDPGTVIGTCQIEATGGDQDWSDVECAVQAVPGVHDLCLRFGGSGNAVMNLDYYSFE